MRLPEVYLVGELRLKNHEIYRIMHSKNDGLNYSIGFLLIEDCNRKTELSDYPFLIDVYKNNPSKFEGGDNIFKVKAILSEPIDEQDESVLEHIGISLVEFKEKVDCIFSVIIRDDLDEWIDMLDDKPYTAYTELLKYTEEKPNVENYSKEKLKRLHQE
ncbi:hypothetical protein HLK66_11065 [Niallia circulans]|uniref:hypothetical protein n=1 Tax=Niallia circulans TaxID=1397 RepID=UPI0013D1BCAF|nr:hypothetical protein [Niallia circulans]QJX62138.1 hypothetical protein HLK66_11065 [Niallia circulans]